MRATVSRFCEMWLKTIVLLRSLQLNIFVEFVNKSPWHYVCWPVNRGFDRKMSFEGLNPIRDSAKV